MKETRYYEVDVSPEEIRQALREAFPENLSVQAIPSHARADLIGNHGLRFKWHKMVGHNGPGARQAIRQPALEQPDSPSAA